MKGKSDIENDNLLSYIIWVWGEAGGPRKLGGWNEWKTIVSPIENEVRDNSVPAWDRYMEAEVM